VADQAGQGLVGKPPLFASEPLRHLLEESLGEGRKVLGSLAQRRQVEIHHLQAVVEILSETAFLDLRLQVPMGRRDHPHVHFDGLRAAHALQGTLLKDPQHLRLGLARHVADLVQEDGSTVGGLESPRPPCVCTRERSLLVSEEFALHQLPADGGAIHRDEGPVLSGAVLVEGLRDQLLAGTAGAANQHRQIGLRHLLDRLEDAPHGGAGPDQVVEAEVPFDSGAQDPVLAGETGALEGSHHHETDLVVVERLGDVVVGPQLHRFDRDLLVAVGGDHHHRRLGLALLGGPEHVHSTRAASQRQIRQYEVVSVPFQSANGLLAVLGLVDLVSLPAQESR
jgi:hypothetical protein